MRVDKLIMKKQAILIQCHNRPELVNRIIQYLPIDYFDFYIHVDKKSSVIDKITNQVNVFVCQHRVDVRWGQFSQVEATIALFDMLKEEMYSYIHLISGTDFVIKSPEYIREFFSNRSDQFIICTKIPEACTWSRGGWDRYSVWYPKWMIGRPNKKILRYLRLVYREFVFYTKLFQRKIKPVQVFYGSSSWFSLTGTAIGWIKSYIKAHPQYIKFFQHAICSDEVFFSTLIMNSPYSDSVTQNNKRYMIWGGKIRVVQIRCKLRT